MGSPDKNLKHIFAVAGEESGNQYLKKIVESFKQDKDVCFSALGFQSLIESGVKVVCPAEEIAVMGLIDVILRWFTIRRAFKKVIQHILESKPDVVLLIDYGGFNLRLAREIKRRSPETKICYFISPKIWVWNKKRALKVKKYVDRMCVVHPFEVDFYKEWDVEAKYVGHPLMEDLKQDYFNEQWINTERDRCGFARGARVLGLLLGSRNSEIRYHLPKFNRVAELLMRKIPSLEVAYVLPPSKDRGDFRARLNDVSFPFKVLQDEEPMSRMALIDLGLVASGTATLQVGLLGKPMAIGFITNPITVFVGKIVVRGLKYFGLINIVHQKKVVPEYLQEQFREDDVVDFLASLLSDSQKFNRMKNELLSTQEVLGPHNAYVGLRDEIYELF